VYFLNESIFILGRGVRPFKMASAKDQTSTDAVILVF